MPVTSGLDLVAGPWDVRAADRSTPAGDATDPGAFEAALSSILDGEPASATGAGNADQRTQHLIDIASDGSALSPDALALAAQPVPMPSPIPTETKAARGAAPTTDGATTDAVTTQAVTTGAITLAELGASGRPVTDASTPTAGAGSEPRRDMSLSSLRGGDVTGLAEKAQHVLAPEATTLPDTGRHPVQPDTTKVRDATILPDLATLPDTSDHTLPRDATTLPDDFREAPATRVGTRPDVATLPDIAQYTVRSVATLPDIAQYTVRSVATLPDLERSAPQSAAPTAPTPPTNEIDRRPMFGSVEADSDVAIPPKSTDDPMPREPGSITAVDRDATSTQTRQAPSPVGALESPAISIPVTTRLLAVAEASSPVSSPAARTAVAEQLVSVVRPLAGSNGSHTMTLDLHPADLGRVRLEITVEGATVHVALHTERATTSALLHQTMPELRRSLDAAGLTAGRIGLDSGASTSSGHTPDLRNPEAGHPMDLTGNQNQSGQEQRRSPRSRDSGGISPDERSYVQPVRSSTLPAVTTAGSRRRSVDVLL